MNRIKKISAFIMALVMILAVSGLGRVEARAEGNITPVKGQNFNVQILPGQTNHVSVKFNAPFGGVSLTSMAIVPKDTDLMKIENIDLKDDYGNTLKFDENMGIMILNSGVDYTLSFDVIGSDSLKIGYSELYIQGSVIDYSTGSMATETIGVLTTYTPYELDPIDLVVTDVAYTKNMLVPGGETNLIFTIKNEGDMKAVNASLVLDFGSSKIIPNYTVTNIKLGEIKGHSSVTKSVSVKVLGDATPGQYQITADISCKTEAGDSKSTSKSVYVIIAEAQKDSAKPNLEISSKDNYRSFVPGTEDKFTVQVTNSGTKTAHNIIVKITDGFSILAGLTPKDLEDSYSVGTLKPGETKNVVIPVIVSKSFSSGTHEVKLETSYSDEASVPMTAKKTTLYIEGPEEITGSNYITISSVKQTPAVPKAGENFTISFNVKNDGQTPIENVRFFGQGYSSTGFEPINSEPYQTVGTIEGGKSKTVSMTFKVGEKITPGLNSISIGYDYVTVGGERKSDSVSLYVLDVVNEITTNVGRPKLIITEYSECNGLKAGGEFDFKFTLKNTHSYKDAKNIKVTVSQKEGYMSVAEGTNIFYIEQIKAGEAFEQEMRLKSKADCATGDYALSIDVEYEYENMSAVDAEKGGVSDTNEIKIHITENYRPEVQNVRIESWDTVFVGTPVDLSFEFYNMGKSTLGNVSVTVEGDFELSNNSTMSYVGAIQGYSQEYVSVSVVPLVSGLANGTVVIHFEDSNGDEQTISKEFSQYIEDTNNSYNPGMEDPGEVNPGGIYFPGEEEPAESEGPAWWIYVAIGGGVLVVAVVVVIIVKKAKKRKSEGTLNDEDY